MRPAWPGPLLPLLLGLLLARGDGLHHHGGWRPVSPSAGAWTQLAAASTTADQQPYQIPGQIHRAKEKVDNIQDKLISVEENAFVQNTRRLVSNLLDSAAVKIVRLSAQLLGAAAPVSYDAAAKTITAYGVEFDLIYAVDQFVLVLTEFWAYVTTDLVFRILWPER